MMTKKDETPPFYAIRLGNVLKPEFSFDLEALEQFPNGSRIKVTLSTGRSPKRLRWYWSFLKKVIDATEAAPDVESFHQVIKLSTGYTTPVMVRGFTVLVPRSISFSSMTEEDFATFCANAERFIAQNYGITPEDVFKGE